MSLPTFAPNENNRDSAQKLLYGLLARNSIKSTNVTVGTTAVALPTTALTRRLSLAIFNNSSSVIYIGASDVTTSTGYPIYPRGQFIIPIDDNIDVYAISADSNLNIRVMEGG